MVNAKPKKEGGQSGPCGKGCKLCKSMKEVRVVKDKDGNKKVHKYSCGEITRTTGVYPNKKWEKWHHADRVWTYVCTCSAEGEERY